MNDRITEIREALEVFDNPPNSTGAWEDDRTVGVALSVLAGAARAYVDLLDQLPPPSDPVTLDDWRFCKVHGSARDYEDVDDPTCDASREWSDPCEWLTHVQVLEGMGAKRVGWCEKHQVSRWSDQACFVGGNDVLGGHELTCLMVESLVLPLPTPQEEK